MTAEMSTLRGGAEGSIQASMRPRSNDRGNLEPCMLIDWTDISFNEAAI